MGRSVRESRVWWTYAGTGAAAGAIAHWCCATVPGQPVPRAVATLALATVAGIVLGFVARRGGPASGPAALGWFFAGTAAALAPAATFAAAQRPMLFFAWLMLFPVCVGVGVAAGSRAAAGPAG